MDTEEEQDVSSLCDIDNTMGTCLSWANCTSTGYIANWTEQNCQPESVKRSKDLMLTSLGIVGIAGFSLNVLVLSTFLYLYFCKNRIRRKFNREFSLTSNPLIVLFSHLCFCDLLYACVGVPSYVMVYAYGYFPLSHDFCRTIVFFRDSIAYADFTTLAVTAACIAWNYWFTSRKIEKKRTMFGLIFLIWVECIILTSFPYFGWYGQFGFDPIHGKCHLVECDEDSENGKIKPSILINTIERTTMMTVHHNTRYQQSSSHSATSSSSYRFMWSSSFL